MQIRGIMLPGSSKKAVSLLERIRVFINYYSVAYSKYKLSSMAFKQGSGLNMMMITPWYREKKTS